MPNHWESSARPLFVKTVYVNGSRHAVLFEKDPLLHRENSPYKKTSRPSSSISFCSDHSIATSKSEEYKPVNLRQNQNKDLSTELQSCLVKLKLASVNRSNSREDKCLCAKEAERIQGRGSSKQKRQKWNREKRKQCEREESRACKLSGRKNSCYIYNLENYNGKKNYCFVKISSQPPEFLLNCCCCCGSDQNHTCDHANKNMVISATIQNLVMTPDGRGNFFPFENAELYWNNYVTTSYYNSLSERVMQWLDLARKRKKQDEKLNGTVEDEAMNATERICSRKVFADEIRKTECSFKSDNRISIKEDKFTRNDTPESDVEGEVIGEPNVETLISKDLTGNIPSNQTFHNQVENFDSKRDHNSENSSTKTDFSYLLTAGLKDSAPKWSNIPRPAKSALKIQDLLLNCHSKENYSKRKTKDMPKQKSKEKENGEGEDLLITTLNNWTEEVSKKNVFVGKFDKQQRCHCTKKLQENADKIKNQILTESLPERNQKSINNPNSTRGRPVLIQNLLSPQQPDKMSYLQEEKIVWASEKNTGRPQLHIFMPSIALRDQSDDSMSECDNYFNLAQPETLRAFIPKHDPKPVPAYVKHQDTTVSLQNTAKLIKS